MCQLAAYIQQDLVEVPVGFEPFGLDEPLVEGMRRRATDGGDVGHRVLLG